MLSATSVANTAPTVVTGDLGVSPGTPVTGFPPGVVNGSIHLDDPTAQQAQSDLGAAIATGATEPCTTA